MMTNTAHQKSLVVEDDQGISSFLKTVLKSAGYDVLFAETGKSALGMISSHCPDCILLDLGLPDMDGSEIIRSVRSWTQTPIIVISARGTENDKAGALDMGADDYLTKPFGTVELLARIRTGLRHTRTTAENEEIALSDIYTVDEMTVDYRKMRVYIGEKDAVLTPKCASS